MENFDVIHIKERISGHQVSEMFNTGVEMSIQKVDIRMKSEKSGGRKSGVCITRSAIIHNRNTEKAKQKIHRILKSGG